MMITEAERRRARATGTDAAEEGVQEGQKEAEVWHLKMEYEQLSRIRMFYRYLENGQTGAGTSQYTSCDSVALVTAVKNS